MLSNMLLQWVNSFCLCTNMLKAILSINSIPKFQSHQLFTTFFYRDIPHILENASFMVQPGSTCDDGICPNSAASLMLRTSITTASFFCRRCSTSSDVTITTPRDSGLSVTTHNPHTVYSLLSMTMIVFGVTASTGDHAYLIVLVRTQLDSLRHLKIVLCKWTFAFVQMQMYWLHT